MFNKRLLLLISLAVALNTPLFGALTYVNSRLGPTHVVKGHLNDPTDVLMLTFTVSSNIVAGEDIKKISISNNSGNIVKFGQGISSLYVVQDSTGDGAYDPNADTSIVSSKAANAFTALKNAHDIDFSSNPITVSGNRTFHIFYEVDKTSGSIGRTTNITLTSIETSSSTFEATNVTSSTTPTHNDVTRTAIDSFSLDGGTGVSGVRGIKITDISPKIALPGQTKIPLLHIALSVQGERVDSDGTTFKIFNEESNFPFGTQNNDTISKIEIYSTSVGPDFVSSSNITRISQKSTATDAQSLLFDFASGTDTVQNSFNLGDPNISTLITDNFVITYDVDPDISVTSSTEIAAQFFEFTGLGNGSKSNNSNKKAMKWPESESQRNVLSPVATVKIAGFSVEEAVGIVPDESNFGPETEVPMMRFDLRANHTAITLNSITLKNSSPVDYEVNSDGSDGVIQIELFRDKDGNEEFNRAVDERIGNIDLGTKHELNAQTNSKTIAKIPIQTYSNGVTTNGLKVSSYQDDSSNEESIFVVYHIGTTVTPALDASGNVSSIADAQLVDIFGETSIVLNNSLDTLTKNIQVTAISESTPLEGTPVAEVDLQETTVTILASEPIVPNFAIQGQEKVPMLYLQIKSEATLSSTNFTVLNSAATFTNDHTGVEKVLIFKDENKNKKIDSDDTFLSASNQSTLLETNISGVPLAEGTNHLLILYEIGQVATIEKDKVKAQLKNITGPEGTSIVLGGVVPSPISPAVLEIKSAKIGRPTITLSVKPQGSNTSFGVSVGVTNNDSSNVKLKDILIKVYASDISGSDISYEFESTTLDSIAVTINAGATRQFDFTTQQDNPITEGSGVVDVFVRYQATPTSTAVISRYQGQAEWKPAAQTVDSVILFASVDQYDWQFPAYISTVKVQQGSSASLLFTNDMAISVANKMIITFANNGSFIDESSINLLKNDTELSRSLSGTEGSFSYDSTNGVLTIPELGRTSSTIRLNLTDLNGNSLPESSFSYQINSQAQLSRPLFYPNPYVMGKENLLLGFNLTQPANVSIYLYNHMGHEVHNNSFRVSSIGYYTHTINKSESFLRPGIYICRIIAKDDLGNETSGMAKLAIY